MSTYNIHQLEIASVLCANAVPSKKGMLSIFFANS